MKLKIAARIKAKIKLALQVSSGPGKPYSSLLIENRLCDDRSKLTIMDN